MFVGDEAGVQCALSRLLSSVRQEGEGSNGDASENATLQRVLELAVQNRVGPIVAHAIADHDSALDSQIMIDSQSDHRLSASRMSILLGELDGVGEALRESQIPCIALKNAGIARGIYPCAACCPMGDLDVLVEQSRFREAHEIVQQMGFEFSSRSEVEGADLDHAIEQGGGTEYVKQVDDVEVWLELQWRPIAGRWIRKDQEPDGAECIARSVPIDGTAVRLLSPVDNMIQVALHTAKHSYLRAPGLRLHTDVDRLAHYYTPEWSDVVAEAERLEVKTAVYFSLAIPKELFDTPIPDEVLEALEPPAWKKSWITRWIRRAGLFNPDEKKFSRPGMMLFHALLYDDLSGLIASVCDEDKNSITIRNSPRLIKQASRRLMDIATRYQP